MFNNSSVMALINMGNLLDVRIIQMNSETQSEICKSFATITSTLIDDKRIVRFDGNYKPNDDEILSIRDFVVPTKIIDAIKHPLGLQSLTSAEAPDLDVRAIFIGELFENGAVNIAFQRFRKEQYLSSKGFRLFFDNDTFIKESRWGICLTDTIDCVFINNELRFPSYHYARQIFNLSEYYRSATDAEVLDFSQTPSLNIADISQFQSMADTWIRRKIAAINDSCVLQNNTATKIEILAQQCGLEICIVDEKLEIPADKKKLKEILGFLDDEVYKGAFSEETYITNSKRKL